MAKVVVTKSKLDSLAQHINTKAGTTGAKTIAQMQATVDGITGGAAPVTYSQVNPVVAAYLADVTYSPSDYSTSQVETYASQATTYRKDQPSGVDVAVKAGDLLATDALGGVLRKTVAAGAETLYNLAPMAEGADYVVQQSGNVSGSGHLTPTGALRMIKVGTTLSAGSPFNIRDLGGWPCDGGTIRYGLLFRGGELNGSSYGVVLTDADKAVFLEQLDIRAEIDLRSASEIANITGSALGSAVAWEHYAISPYAAGINVNGTGLNYAPLLRSIIKHVCDNEPCYIHCLLGADRTGTVCAIIESLLGISQSNMDKDYELTSFKGEIRKRNGDLYVGFVNYIGTMEGNTWRDKMVNWAQRIGITIDEINALRAAMIDGTPDVLTSTVTACSVTNALTNAATNNSATATARYQPYKAKIAAANGYAISSVKVKMGGVDVTSRVWNGTETNLYRKVTENLTHCTSDNSRGSVIDGQGYAATLTAAEGYTLEGATISIAMGGVDVSTYYKDGVIAIPNVTGDLEITVTAVKSAPSYTNQIPISTDADGSIYNSIGYMLNMRLPTNGVPTAASGYLTTGFIPFAVGDTIRANKFTATSGYQSNTKVMFYNSNKATIGGQSGARIIADGNYTLGEPLTFTPPSTIYDSGAGVNKDISAAAYIRLTIGGYNNVASDIICTINEEIT